MAAERHPRDLVRRVYLLLRRVCDVELQPYGLSFAQFAVLRAVAQHPQASLTRLAGCSGMRKQAVHQVLRGLRAASLVAVVEPTRGPGQRVELAAAGRLLLATATDVVDRAEDRMLAGIAPQERDRLTMLLQRCAENLETPQPPPSDS
jgi:DNA-binding MarR family transcriptional regulator